MITRHYGRWTCEYAAGDLEEPVGYDGFGAPLYAHQIPAQGTE